MAQMSNPTLKIQLISGTSNADVTASVRVSLDSTEESLVKLVGLKFKLRCRLWGEDGLLNSDDVIYSFPAKTVVADGTYTFHKTISRDTLDEDWEGNDEVYAKFSITSSSPIFPLSVPPMQSPTIHGNF